MACSVRAAFGSRVSLTRRPSLARRVCRQTVLTVPLLVRAMATGECPVRGIAAQLRVEGHTPSHTTRPTRRVATGSAGMELDKNTPEEVRRGRASSLWCCWLPYQGTRQLLPGPLCARQAPG